METNRIGYIIRNLRVKSGLTQKGLAEKLSVSTSTISHWENGRRLPSITELGRISQLFNVNFNTFENELNLDTYDQPLPDHDPAQIQTIYVRPLGFNLCAGICIMYFCGLIIGLISVYLNAYLNYISFFLSLLALLVVIVYYLISCVSNHVISKKQIGIPISHIIYYQHHLGHDSISIYRRRLLNLSILLIISTTVLYTLSSFLFNGIFGPYFGFIIVIFGLVAFCLVYFKYRRIANASVFHQRLDYYTSAKDLNYRIFFIALIFDLFVYLSIIYLVLMFNLHDQPYLLFFVLLIALFQTLVSFLMLIKYKSFINGFSVYSLSPTKEVRKLQ